MFGGGCRLRDPGGCFRYRRLYRDRDHVFANVELVAVDQLVGALDPLRVVVDEGAIGRDVIEPVSAVEKPDFAMLARDEPAWVGQSPIEMLITAKVQPPLVHLDEQRSAIGEAIEIFNSKC